MKKAVLLVLPSLLALCVPIYNFYEPRFLGFPFFYWFLLILIPLSCIATFLVYIGEKR
jgi:hypothetical protein